MHYKDMTFCTFYEDCRDKNECPRPLTTEVKDQANKWWMREDTPAPIAQFADKPHCHRKQTYKESVQDFAKKLDGIPKEIREMSGVPSAIIKQELPDE